MDLAGSTWLLTGANGTIGRRVRVHLRDRVARLVVTDLVPPDDPQGAEVAQACDVTDPRAVAEAVRGCHGVLHLAAIADEAAYEDLVRVNVLGTHHVLEAMRIAGVRRLVYASSNRVTGFHPTGELLDERATIRPDGLYGASKAAAEALARMYADKFGIQVSTLRIGTYAEHPASAREAATWLSPGDACRAIEAAMTTDLPFSVFYAVSANRHRFWSLEPGRAVGYVPVDDASHVLGPDVRPEPGTPQADDMASPEFTLRHL